MRSGKLLWVRLAMLAALSSLVPACENRDDDLPPQMLSFGSPSIAIFGSNPVVGWQGTASGRSQIYLRRWTGAVWEELGASGSGGGISNSPQSASDGVVAIDSTGNPMVAWCDTASGNSEIYLMRWNGASWIELGGSASAGGISSFGIGGGSAYHPTLAVDAADNPVVAWERVAPMTATWSLYLKRWTGAAWVEVGSSATASGIAATGIGAAPSLALNTVGHPAVAWQDGTSGNLEVYFKRWTGAAWEELAGSASTGGVSNTTGISEFPSLALESTGSPVIAWQDGTPGNLEIYLKRWDGAQWIELASSATGGGISGTSVASQACSLTLESGNQSLVAWQEGTADSEIFLKRWDGLQWVQLGGSGSGIGLSNTSGASQNPSLARDTANAPAAAWVDTSPNRAAIYLKRWDGLQWVELGSSGSGGGISN